MRKKFLRGATTPLNREAARAVLIANPFSGNYGGVGIGSELPTNRPEPFQAAQEGQIGRGFKALLMAVSFVESFHHCPAGCMYGRGIKRLAAIDQQEIFGSQAVFTTGGTE